MRISAVLCLISVAALAACGSQKTTYTTANGTATVTKNGGTTTYESKAGKITVGAGVDLSKLGAPVYPGATQNDENSAMSVSSSKGSGTVAAFSTSDKFSSVEAWYKARLPKGSEKMNANTGDSSIAEFVTSAGTPNQTSVMITTQDGKTQLVITHGQ